MEKDNVIKKKSFLFAIEVVELYKILIEERREYVLSKQVLRSGTSIGANIEEAIGGFSKKDFRAKLSISYKEARETRFWLNLLNATGYLNEKRYRILSKNLDEIIRILIAILKKTNDWK